MFLELKRTRKCFWSNILGTRNACSLCCSDINYQYLHREKAEEAYFLAEIC